MRADNSVLYRPRLRPERKRVIRSEPVGAAPGEAGIHIGVTDQETRKGAQAPASDRILRPAEEGVNLSALLAESTTRKVVTGVSAP